jgi:beta-ketoacyl-acyl-carrier-protein synthase II
MKWSANDRPRRVVITGLGVVSPIGCGKQEFWQNALAGKSGIRKIDRFRTNGFKAKIAGQVENFEPEDFDLSKLQIRRLDRYAQFALAAARQAIEDSDLLAAKLDSRRIGTCVSNAIGGTRLMEAEFIALTHMGSRELDVKWAQRSLYQASTFNVASAEIASTYGWNGPCLTVSTGCTGGLDAIGTALESIRHGETDVMLCGAAEAPITPIALAAFDVIGALSTRWNDEPERASRPFDKNRDGFVLGEGAGILVLEEREHALRRNATIYAEVRGFGSCNNAYHMTDLPPEGEDLARSIRLALQDARISPVEIDYVSAHGSSTPQNDVNETAACKAVLGMHAYTILMSSLKSMVGHPLAAANAVEMVAAAMTIQSGRVHPTLNFEQKDPACDLDYVPQATEERVNVVLKNASGFSGIHSSLVLTSPEYQRSLQ